MKKLLGLFVLLMALAPPVFAEDARFVTHTFHSAVTVDGDGTDLVVDKYTTLAVTVAITNTATVTFRVSQNGTTFVDKLCVPSDDTTAVVSVSSSAQVQCNIAGYQIVRMVISACSSCTVTVTGRATTAIFGGGGSGGGATPTLDQVIATGAETDNATSLASAVKIGGTLKWCIYEDATTGLQLRPCTASDVRQLILTNFTGGFYDEENDCWILRIDPDAASPNAAWTYTCSATKPVEVAYWDAGAIAVDGTNCGAPTEQALNSAEKTWAFSCADSGSSIFSGKIRMPKSWDLGTVTFTLSLYHATTESITFAGDFSAQCRRAGTTDVINSTYGTAVAADVSITTAHEIEEATTAAVTPNGTCAAEAWLQWRYVVDAANFSANAANAKVLGVTMKYSKGSVSN